MCIPGVCGAGQFDVGALAETRDPAQGHRGYWWALCALCLFVTRLIRLANSDPGYIQNTCLGLIDLTAGIFDGYAISAGSEQGLKQVAFLDSLGLGNQWLCFGGERYLGYPCCHSHGLCICRNGGGGALLAGCADFAKRIRTGLMKMLPLACVYS